MALWMQIHVDVFAVQGNAGGGLGREAAKHPSRQPQRQLTGQTVRSVGDVLQGAETGVGEATCDKLTASGDTCHEKEWCHSSERRAWWPVAQLAREPYSGKVGGSSPPGPSGS